MHLHNEPSEFAGKKVRIKQGFTHPQYPEFNGGVVSVEDWWDRVSGKPWGISVDNPAALIYAMRIGTNGLPMDDEVVYGKLGPMGVIVHVSEIEGLVT